jgi:curved DNA-binding protein CbpA
MEVLGYGPADEPSRDDVRRRYRRLLRLAHPDHGGEADAAADRIEELAEARRTLLAGLDAAG